MQGSSWRYISPHFIKGEKKERNDLKYIFQLKDKMIR